MTGKVRTIYDNRYVVMAERHDGSTIADNNLTVREVFALVATSMAYAKRATIWVDDGAPVTESGPVQNMEDAINWKQPDDILTEMFRAKEGR
jgi:hypothetical protein